MSNIVTRQTPVKWLGVFRQLFGGASSWMLLYTTTFAGMAGWESGPMLWVRDVLPWLTFPVFVGLSAIGMVLVMWSEHKWTQPGILVYWNEMFWNHGSQLRQAIEKQDRRLARIEKALGIKNGD